MMNFCTLFDSYYLDKGLALYRSLERVSKEFHLYIFCFDEKSRQILADYALPHATILSHKDIESEEEKLPVLKKERSKAEYCWTCTPVIIEYVLKHFPVESCTYIDADLYFFSDPGVLFDEIKEAGADVVITEHRFSQSLKDRRLLKRSGKYCVEFNYFCQSENSRRVLTWWKEKCFEWCYHIYEAERMGDQKYLEQFPKLFDGIHELQHLGGGVAPWNLGQYRLAEESDSQADPLQKNAVQNSLDIRLVTKKSGTEFPLIFYHFQNIRYLGNDKVNINSCIHDKALKEAIYLPYLAELEKVRSELKKKGITFEVKKSYASNKWIAFAQRNILQYKIRSWSDLIELTRVRGESKCFETYERS